MRHSLSSVKPYLTPKTDGLGLQSNTNRLGPNPVFQRLGTLLDGLDLNNYPDNAAVNLCQALGNLYDLSVESFLITNGSNEAFDIIFKTFLNPGETAAFPSPSYSMYPYYAKANAVNALEIPLDENFDLDVDGFLKLDAELLILCSPNNPTGNTLSVDRIETILNSGRRVVVDEAYGEFANDHWISQIEKYPNLIVTRTLSKAYGLAGLRLGYLATHPDTVDLIMRARLPYNVNTLSQVVAVAALQEKEFLKQYLSLISEQRPLWSNELQQRGFHVYPSQSNFILAKVPDDVNRDNPIQWNTFSIN
jgi:histidinol-phosphate aminotransferase